MGREDEDRQKRVEARAKLRAEPQWYIVECNPQSERKAVAELRMAGFRAYLPLKAVYRRRRDDKLPVKRWPALVGYVLMSFRGASDWYRFHRCQGVRGVVHLDGAPYSLPQSEVAAIMRDQRRMRFDAPNARAVRKSWQQGERNARRALAAIRFQPGDRVYNAGAMIMARVVEVTKRGTVKAIIEEKARDTPVEFSDLDHLQLVDREAEAA